MVSGGARNFRLWGQYSNIIILKNVILPKKNNYILSKIVQDESKIITLQ